MIQFINVHFLTLQQGANAIIFKQPLIYTFDRFIDVNPSKQSVRLALN